MSTKRFGTQLRELLSTLDSKEKLTPSELIERVSGAKVSGASEAIILSALKKLRFRKKVGRAVRRSESGRVILYTRKDEPMVMTVERMDTLGKTVKKAQAGVRKYWDKNRIAA